MPSERVAVIGAGVAGLVAALRLAARGVDVIVLERASDPGGKMREVAVGPARIDAGPTVLTMRWVFDEIFSDAGASFDSEVTLSPVEIIARHAWGPRERLDLHADPERSADAIGDFAGREAADGFRRFCRRARDVYETLEGPFIRAPHPSLPGLVRGAGLRGLPALARIRPFTSLWRTLGEDFRDVRLRQLFARYATYVGSSPFLAPATLMLIAHVEQLGVHVVEGGMHRIATALAGLAERHGARIRYGVEVVEISTSGGRVSGIALSTGERIAATAVLCNADAAALASGRFGPGPARSVTGPQRSERSLSAVTWALLAPTEGFPLVRHNVFFSRRYAAEFDDIYRHGRLPSEPTVYVCAQDRPGHDRSSPTGAERLLCLVNAPATGDANEWDASEIGPCEERAFDLMASCGLRISTTPSLSVRSTPRDFDRLFPSTGGALYGAASHGWRAAFRRPGLRTALAGLYLAGGSSHPGPGVPMVALAGRMAADSILMDFASTRKSPSAATAGGTRTR